MNLLTHATGVIPTANVMRKEAFTVVLSVTVAVILHPRIPPTTIIVSVIRIAQHVMDPPMHVTGVHLTINVMREGAFTDVPLDPVAKIPRTIHVDLTPIVPSAPYPLLVVTGVRLITNATRWEAFMGVQKASTVILTTAVNEKRLKRNTAL